MKSLQISTYKDGTQTWNCPECIKEYPLDNGQLHGRKQLKCSCGFTDKEDRSKLIPRP